MQQLKASCGNLIFFCKIQESHLWLNFKKKELLQRIKLSSLEIEKYFLNSFTPPPHMSHEKKSICAKFKSITFSVSCLWFTSCEIQSKMNFYKAHFINDWLQSCNIISCFKVRNIFLRSSIFKINPSWSTWVECNMKILNFLVTKIPLYFFTRIKINKKLIFASSF
mgnify:CR=1 FL=1